LGISEVFARLAELAAEASRIRPLGTAAKVAHAGERIPSEIEEAELARQIWQGESPVDLHFKRRPLRDQLADVGGSPSLAGTDKIASTRSAEERSLKVLSWISDDVAVINRETVSGLEDKYQAYQQASEATGLLGNFFGRGNATVWLSDPRLAKMSGIAVTSSHLVGVLPEPWFFQGIHGQSFTARLVAAYEKQDIALLHVESLGDRAPYLKTADHTDRLGLHRGDPVYMVGHPIENASDASGKICFGISEPESPKQPVLSTGGFEGIGGGFHAAAGYVSESVVIKTSASRFGGFSGSSVGILNRDKQYRVIGIHSRGAVAGGSLASASVYVNPALEFIAKNGIPERGFIRLIPSFSNGKLTVAGKLEPPPGEAPGLMRRFLSRNSVFIDAAP
jgi:S1-C subfamily serine protease